MYHRVSRAVGALALSIAALAPVHHAAAADSYPDRPIRLVIPYAPGGSLDPIGRVLSERLAQRLGQPVVVENLTGANGMVGTAKVVSAKPDGYTLLVGITSNVSLAPLVAASPSYKATDLDAIGKVGTSGLVLLARPDLKVDTLADVLKLARDKPGSLSYGIPGSGSLFHLVMEKIKADAGVDIAAIPYRGAGQASTDLMGGQIDLALLGLPAMLPHIAAKKLNALAVTSATPDIGNPAIPVAAKTAGLQGIDYTIWTGLFAPKGTPAPIKERLNTELRAILAEPAIVETYRKMGVEVAAPQSVAEFSTFVANDTERLRKDIQQTKFQPE
ncbi:tripartite tricarboxylate transporter substrate binding protein [Pusillimonas sp. TS35]|uniref:Bug family tripartite tricarboxylate transporter substrate binding protein n=1 Tax=Paracandidimonas lactea TaxID=2895524 RepID=UPI001369EEA3|nr:tripartite tricarboxylate transporter substrate binding protein [Paracandidimonas lactea]MYN12872.1 tripartite tricarboxylate transporter substrate binding protein [Pusillimonas sp. TS35]